MAAVNECWKPGCTDTHPPSFPYCKKHAKKVKRKIKKASKRMAGK